MLSSWRLLLVSVSNATPTTEIYTLSLHDALPILISTKESTLRAHSNHRRFSSCKTTNMQFRHRVNYRHLLKQLHKKVDRKSTRLNSSHVKSSYAVFCLKKKNT